MKLNQSSLYLTLAIRSLDSAVLPELQSPAGCNAATMIRNCLQQLLTRECVAIDALRANLAKGEALATRMRKHLLDRSRDADDIVAVALRVDRVDSFVRYAAAHDLLSSELAALAKALSAARKGGAGDVEISALLREGALWEAEAHGVLLQQTEAQAAEEPREGMPGEALEAFIQSVHPDGKNARITTLERVPGGYAKLTYLTKLRDSSGAERELIVRKDDVTPVFLHRAVMLKREYDLVRAVAATGYPAPKPLWFGKDVPGVDADFYVMEKLPGKVAGSFLGGGNVPESVALELAQYLAQLHSLGPKDFPDFVAAHEDAALLALDDTVEACYRRIISGWQDYVQSVEHLPSPMIAYVLDWLYVNVPKVSSPPVLVHGDYNIHNVLTVDGHITAVLDWELAGFGAPEEDIGYIKPMISRYIDWEKFYQHYLACGGKHCNFETLGYYGMIAALRALLAGSRMTRNLQAGETRDIQHTIHELSMSAHFWKVVLDSTG